MPRGVSARGCTMSVLVFETVVSTGLGITPTVPGKFNIYWKLGASDMGGPGYYHLVRVPYTMY